MEKTLKITEEQAKKLYLEASANFKEVLVKSVKVIIPIRVFR